MKREELKVKAEELGIELSSELINFIMSENGKDINEAKNAGNSEVEKIQNKLNEITIERDNLNARVDKYKDYDELVKYKQDNEAKAEVGKREEFLKSKGIKFPELIIDKIDWNNLTYNSDKKAYEGEGIEEKFNQFKEQYGDSLFNVENKQTTLPINDTNSQYDDLDGVEKIFYDRYPKLK